jgi:alcohol dehydrogenase
MLSDILPTGFECGVLNRQVKPGDTIAIVGVGPVGLAVLLTAQFYSPAAILMIDLDDKRLAVAEKFGATNLIKSADGHAAHQVMELTEGAGVDVAIEAVGLPATFEICQAIVAAGGRIANVGVHGKPPTQLGLRPRAALRLPHEVRTCATSEHYCSQSLWLSCRSCASRRTNR